MQEVRKAQQLQKQTTNLFSVHLEAKTRLLLAGYQLYSVDKQMLYDGRKENVVYLMRTERTYHVDMLFMTHTRGLSALVSR